ncbi:ATP-binding protein [Kordiimonas pumila]|uniref:ATP-binding protein n=1 Tax=Kordiimonas pumila TaxID=2161677 RepID=A0ABV7D3L5_9PROT|nr:ATP-binding protein [Kordiimonas pumila]
MTKDTIDTNEALIAALKGLTEAIKGTSNQSVNNNFNKSYQSYVFNAQNGILKPIEKVSSPPLDMLLGIDRAKATLLENSRRFAAGYSANNALLWGARGMGKSTIVKSIHNQIITENGESAPALVEIHREDISHLPSLLDQLRDTDKQFVIYCDDLSFDQPDTDFKALKSVLEGGLEGRPENVIFYATSNRRHLLPRKMADQESATGIHPNESMDETIALSDRFGLWLGFHVCDQQDYLAIISGYMEKFDLHPDFDWHHQALEWSKTRGNRSGRTAWQYVNNLAGQLERKIKF